MRAWKLFGRMCTDQEIGPGMKTRGRRSLGWYGRNRRREKSIRTSSRDKSYRWHPQSQEKHILSLTRRTCHAGLSFHDVRGSLDTCISSLGWSRRKSIARLDRLTRSSSGWEVSSWDLIWGHGDRHRLCLLCVDARACLLKWFYASMNNVALWWFSESCRNIFCSSANSGLTRLYLEPFQTPWLKT
jgi:hypothetical protein